MRTFQLMIGSLFISMIASSQDISPKLDSTVKAMLSDSTMKHAIMGLYVVNSATNEVVYDFNSQVGLAPASCQKIITSIAAFDLLGKEYRWKTELGIDGSIAKDTLHGSIHITGYGDPTLGSWRYAATKPELVFAAWTKALQQLKIKVVEKNLYFNSSKFPYQPLPGGWIWDDIGNYYGAGHFALNWNENQYSIVLNAGDKEGDSVKISSMEPDMQLSEMNNLLKTGKKSSGDNAYIYLAPYTQNGFITGTIPAGEKGFKIAGSMPYPSTTISNELFKNFEKVKFEIKGRTIAIDSSIALEPKPALCDKVLHVFYSPTLDTVNFYFLRRSINLYGEAFIKTIAYEKTGFGNADSGLAIVKRYWQDRGIEKSALHIIDGSGLSPQNRITANSLVTALQYARTKNWFNSFYEALPTYNQMKLKSGTIGGAKSFAGYHKSKNGVGYTVAIIVNNYDGSAAAAVKKMFAVLDCLK